MSLGQQVRSVTQRLASGAHITVNRRIIDPRFRRSRRAYWVQAALATASMLAVLLLVDSFSDAAIAAGLASSVLIVFMHPSSHSATARSLIGGHVLGLLIGSVFSLLLFSGHFDFFPGEVTILRNIALAFSVGILIFLMAVSDTEHPPAAGTVLGIATKAWDPVTTSIIVGAVLLLAFIKYLLHRYLHDLI